MQRTARVAALALAASAVAAASAEPVVFDNRDEAFDWTLYDPITQEPGHALNITQGPDANAQNLTDAQGRPNTQLGIAYAYLSGPPSWSFSALELWGGDDADLSVEPSTTVIDAEDYGGADDFVLRYARAYEPDQSVSLNAPMLREATVAFHNYGADELPPTTFRDRYVVGVEIEIDERYHAGWIVLRARYDDEGRFRRYNAVAWGYESEPGVAITPPASADLTLEGGVDARDLAILLTRWGSTDPYADLDGDGVVGPPDLARLIADWG